MTTFGRVAVTVAVVAVLVGVTALVAHLLDVPEAKLDLPEPPASVETPTTSEELGPKPQPPTQPVESPLPTTPPEAKPPDEGKPPPEPAEEDRKVESAGDGTQAADEGLAMMRDRPVAAQKRLSEAVRAGVVGLKAAEVREAIRNLADQLQLSSRRHPDDTYSKAYRVASGDTLTGIGQRHCIPYQLVMKVNRLSTTGIMAGQTLKVIQGPVHVEILKGRKELRAWLGDVCLRSYQVGLGAEDSTPEGTFIAKNKVRNPPYQPQHKPRSEHRASGAPDNPLGSRWIDIGDHYGIHGTIEPDSIGRSVSEGCIRMHNKDVEELYDLLVIGATKVTIRP